MLPVDPDGKAAFEQARHDETVVVGSRISLEAQSADTAVLLEANIGSSNIDAAQGTWHRWVMKTVKGRAAVRQRRDHSETTDCLPYVVAAL